jgi:hypothetical protein
MEVTCRGNCLQAVGRGVEFLRKRQLANGEFVTLAGPDPDFRRSSKRDPSNFSTMHVANSLLSSGVPDGADLARRAGEFLFSQMLTGGLWRFWTQEHPGSRGMPPDVDDTACITHLLGRMGYALPDNLAMLGANRRADGLFFTWILPRARFLRKPSTWHALWHMARSYRDTAVFFRSGKEPPDRNGVDAVVNANALLVCGDKPYAALIVTWLAQLIDKGIAAESDRWYQSDFSLVYAVARACESGRTAVAPLGPVVTQCLRTLSCRNSLPLDTAQFLCAAFALNWHDESLDRLTRSLLASQNADGSWSARAHYYGGYARARAWGSAELTTGFCVEALGRYLRLTT